MNNKDRERINRIRKCIYNPKVKNPCDIKGISIFYHQEIELMHSVMAALEPMMYFDAPEEVIEEKIKELEECHKKILESIK